MSHTTRLLNRLQDRATIYVHDSATRLHTAAEIGAIVAALATLPDDGKAIAFAAGALLAAEQVGLRAHYLEVLQREIRNELKHWGSGR